MKRLSACLPAVLALCASIVGCGDALEHATVTISYAPPPDQPALVGTNRQRVERAFKSFSDRNGYKCRPQMKRPEEIGCSGPKDIHLTFEPVLNKHEFVAEFSWLDIDGRTHEEFMKHVLTFQNELAGVLGDEQVTFQKELRGR